SILYVVSTLSDLVTPLFFFFHSYCPPRVLHSFPTRRSSDLPRGHRSAEGRLGADFRSTASRSPNDSRAEAEERVLPPRLLRANRSEEHTSELQSRFDLVCRLLLEKKKKIK